jgi:metallo-beta-lactamase family protein
VFVDSPLAVNASEIFAQHADLFDQETKTFVKEFRHPALSFRGLNYIRSVDESKAINDMHEPMVIISASGMAETGRILHHLKNNIGEKRNTVMIVSWQAPDTLGRRLAERERFVSIFGERYECRAEVATIGGLSAHGGQDMLLKYAQNSKASLKRIFLVHGEPAAAGALRAKLLDAGFLDVVYPERAEEVEL